MTTNCTPMASSAMGCRPGCGACCIAPSITSPIPEMPHGKPAGVRCIQLNEQNLCQLFGQPERPHVCLAFDYDRTLCGVDNRTALDNITLLEIATQ